MDRREFLKSLCGVGVAAVAASAALAQVCMDTPPTYNGVPVMYRVALDDQEAFRVLRREKEWRMEQSVLKALECALWGEE